ncbi:hypothetical protein TNCV_4547961 [Trichonephila clavipes]|nr:hypothetical protein TNCV_4547961 [Trichonephila clavipes]
MHMGLTYDAPGRASSVVRGNENPDAGLECKAFPPNSDNILKVEFLNSNFRFSFRASRRNWRLLSMLLSLQVQSLERSIRIVRHYLAKLQEFLKFDFRLSFDIPKYTRNTLSSHQDFRGKLLPRFS